MRTGVLTTVAALGLGALLVWAPAPASGSTVSNADLKALANTIEHAKKLSYDAQYLSVTDGQRSTVTIAQAPPKSLFASSDSSIVNDGTAIYYCAPSPSPTANSGNTGTTSDSGNTGNSGAATTTSSNGPEVCDAQQGANPLLGLQDIFSPTVALGALAEAKEGLASKRSGIEVSSSSATFAGQPSTCIEVTVRGEGGKYCVTKQGVLSYSGSSASDYFRLTKFSAKPPASLFALPAGATIAATGSTP